MSPCFIALRVRTSKQRLQFVQASVRKMQLPEFCSFQFICRTFSFTPLSKIFQRPRRESSTNIKNFSVNGFLAPSLLSSAFISLCYLLDFHPKKSWQISLHTQRPSTAKPTFHLSQTLLLFLLPNTLSSSLFLRSITEPYPRPASNYFRKSSPLHSLSLFAPLSLPLYTAFSFALSFRSYHWPFQPSIYTLRIIPYTAKNNSLSHFLPSPYAYSSNFTSHD